MLHRRLLHDDSRGVAEALNETTCFDNQCEGLVIEGKYYLKIDAQGEGTRWRWTFGQEMYSPLLLAFAEQDGVNWMNRTLQSSLQWIRPTACLIMLHCLPFRNLKMEVFFGWLAYMRLQNIMIFQLWLAST